MAQPGPMLIQTFRELPVPCRCPVCGSSIITRIDYEIGMFAFMICLFVILAGLWVGCCLIPFCVKSCKDVVHSCPNCGAEVGRYTRM